MPGLSLNSNFSSFGNCKYHYPERGTASRPRGTTSFVNEDGTPGMFGLGWVSAPIPPQFTHPLPMQKAVEERPPHQISH